MLESALRGPVGTDVSKEVVSGVNCGNVAVTGESGLCRKGFSEAM